MGAEGTGSGLGWKMAVARGAGGLLSLFLLLLSLAPLTVTAQEGQALLWQIEGEGIKSSYLYGTIHSGDPRVTRLAAPVQQAYRGANTVVLEMTFDLATIAAVQRAMVNEEATLDSLLDRPLYEEVVRLMASRGVPEEATRTFHPWAVMLTLSTPAGEEGMALDLLLYRRALTDGKATAGLESAQEQLGLFEDISLEEQILMLRDTVAHYAEQDEMFEQLKQAYLRRDMDALLRLSNEAMEEIDAPLRERFLTALVDQRNLRMAERMLPYLTSGAFVAVGALHLPGKGGLVELLKGKGYRLTPLY